MEPKEEYHKTNAKQVIDNFAKRNIEGFYCPDSKQAVKKAMELVTEGASVTWGGTATLKETGLVDRLRESDLEVFDRWNVDDAEEKAELERKAFSSDYYFMSANAITQNGKLINIDGNANRVAALCYGPQNVIVIAGVNKIVADEESARKRVRNYAAPMNSTRLELDTPCTETGHCHQCQVEDTICCQILVTRRSRHEGRIKVILVGEELGF